jgi:hypothetical protein
VASRNVADGGNWQLAVTQALGYALARQRTCGSGKSVQSG